MTKLSLIRLIAGAVAAILGPGIYSSQAQPANDMFDNATVLTGTNIVVTGNNVGATAEDYEPYPAGVSSGSTVWWSWTAPFDGMVTISTAGSTFDTVLGVYIGSSVDSLDEVASNDDDDDNPSVSTSRVKFAADAGMTYHIVVAGYDEDNPGIGTVKLSLQSGPFEQAPAWTLLDLNRASISSTDYAGKVVILDFWATWCGPCRSEIPDLNALQTKYKGDGLVIVGASTDADYRTVSSFMTTFATPPNYKLVMADAATKQAYGGIEYIPTKFIIDRGNVIRARWVGVPGEGEVEAKIIPLLYNNMRLDSHVTATQTVLSWPTNSANFTLESATSLASPNWTPWPVAPTVVNGFNRVSMDNTDSVRFFRLRLNY